MTPKEVAEKYRVSYSWVNKLRRNYQKTGEIGHKRIGGYRKSPLEARSGEIERMIEQTPDMTLREIQEKLDMAISLGALSRFIRKLGITFKKKRYWLPKESAKTSPNPASNGSS
jgi:transposase